MRNDAPRYSLQYVTCRARYLDALGRRKGVFGEPARGHWPGKALGAPSVVWGLLLLLGVCRVYVPRAWALGEQTGSITGRITESATKLALPGVRVKALGEHSGGILGPLRTDQEGHYQILALPPDRYIIEIFHKDAEPYRQAVRVDPGQHLTLNIEWKILARSEQKIIIERENPMRPDSASTSSTLTASSLASLATRRTFWDVSVLVPGTRDPIFDEPKFALRWHRKPAV